VPEDELVSLYNAASVFVFPSFYEGFGLPVVEAMQCGCPVICSNRGSLPEVAGDAAVIVEELDDINTCVRELAEKMKTVLSDKSLREALVRAGFEQAGKFSWDKTAMETIKVYEAAYKVTKREKRLTTV
jgi:glycosyltransferase involved in cell wall biosynthesis